MIGRHIDCKLAEDRFSYAPRLGAGGSKTGGIVIKTNANRCSRQPGIGRHIDDVDIAVGKPGSVLDAVFFKREMTAGGGKTDNGALRDIAGVSLGKTKNNAGNGNKLSHCRFGA
jgi:hypothetical protein